MDKVRKRSTAPAIQSISDQVDVEAEPRLNSKVKTKVHRNKPNTFGRSSKSWVFLIGVGFCFLVYLLFSVVISLNSQQNINKSNSLRSTMDRILHHPFPLSEIGISIEGGHIEINAQKYLPQRPRVIGTYFETATSDTVQGTEIIDANIYRLHKTHTKIEVSSAALQAQKDLLNSRDYDKGLADSLETKKCKAQYEWQLSYKPTCNHLFEQDLSSLRLNKQGKEEVRLLANGYWRDVWKLQNNEEKTVLKTIRYEHDYEPRNYDRHRRDAVAMEQLTSNEWIMDIYGFCGNSGIFEFADGGSLEDSLFTEDDTEKEWTPSEKLVVAYQVSSGISAVHNYPKEGVAAIAHTDVTASQFVYVGSTGVYKLNDFNRCRFISWSRTEDNACHFHVGNNPGTFRSPEEYAYEPESEKVDVYSMGNIFYVLLTGLWPFEDVIKDKHAQKLVKNGKRPKIDDKFFNTTDPFEKALMSIIVMAWRQDPEERASAKDIQTFIESELNRLDVKKT